MSNNFHVGQKVVCVDDGPGMRSGAEHGLVRGAVYQIRGFSRHANEVRLGVQLEEIIYPLPDRTFFGDEPGFAPHRFRPVRTTSIQVFTDMLAPAPKQREDA